MRGSIPVLISLALLLGACGKSPQNPAPAASTAPPAASAAAPAASTAAAPSTAAAATAATAASTAPGAVTSSAVAGATTVAPGEATTAGPEKAGEVALAQGSVTDTATDGSSRQLKDGDDVYPGDSFVLGSDSYLDLDLEDTGRILLRPNTSFQIKSFHYEQDAHDPSAPTDANGQPLIKPQQPENAFFRLIKGGLRAVDGVIGHTSPQNYGVETPVATIGVRGTSFDVRYCGDDCQDEADTTGAPANGLYTSVDEGSIGVKNDGGETINKAGDFGYVATRQAKLQRKDHPPRALRHMRLPDKLKARADTNRNNIKIKRQKRRALILQRRRQAAAARAKAAAEGKPLPAARGPAAKGQAPTTPAERRQERRQQLEERRRDRTGAPAAATGGRAERLQRGGENPRQQEHERRRNMPASAPARSEPDEQGGGRPKPGELRREKREQRRQERQQAGQSAAGTTTTTPAKQDKAAKSAGDKCKDKKKRKKDKDKDKCGGD